jgi:pyrroloquinoline quinone biosynthesis protein D
MAATFTDGSMPTLAPGFRFQWEEAQGCYVILYPEGMVKMNQSAGEILRRCDGSKTVGAIVQDLNQQFPDVDNLKADVHKFLEVAYDHGWIRFNPPA